jgi:glutamate-5-semialdehyde dehydrogenase
MNPHTDLKQMAIAAKGAAVEMSKASLEQKNGALRALIRNLKDHEEAILQANRRDLTLAKSNGLNAALLERLSLTNRLEGIIHDIKQVIALPDPIGVLFDEQNPSNQLKLTKCSTPIGALGVIYESRPNVTLDISVLTIKSGNCAVLRGGSETLHTNQILVEVIQQSLLAVGLPVKTIQLMADSDRAQVKQLLQLHEYIDLIIPRGGAALQQFCREHSTIPVITGGMGICHLFVDETADLERSLMVILNAKTQRPTVCNALDTLLVHSAVASIFIPKVVKTLNKKEVVFRLDPKAWKIMQDPVCQLAESIDWDTEWLSLVLGIKVVESLEEAIQHIRVHSTGHSDGILTENHQHAELFIQQVDSAAVYVNASTRFTDGGQFGLGAEVAISTQKLHARGPMGLKELTSYKWIVRGDYQIRT